MAYYKYDRTNGVMAVIRAARPSFRNKHDKVAFAVHATFLNAGYYLTAAGKDDAFTYSTTVEGEYCFVYATDARGFKEKVQVKCIAAENKLMVVALAPALALALVGGTSTSVVSVHIELGIDVDDYVMEGGNNNHYSDHYKKLEGLVKLVYREIISYFYDWRCGAVPFFGSSPHVARLEEDPEYLPRRPYYHDPEPDQDFA